MSSFSSSTRECHENTATASLSPVPVTPQDPSLPSTSHISFVLWDRLKMARKEQFSPVLSSAEQQVSLQSPFYLSFLPQLDLSN